MAVGMDMGHIPPQPQTKVFIVKSDKNNKSIKTRKKKSKKQKGG